MKKIVFSLIVLSSSVLAFGQSFVVMDSNEVVVSNSIVDIVLNPSSTNTTEILVNNTSGIDKSVRVLRTVLNIDALDLTQYCWGGLCYGASTNLSNLFLNIVSEDTVAFVDGGFHAVFNSGPECLTRLVHYRFFDSINNNDSTGVTLRYICTVGINENTNENVRLSDVYPNPVNAISSINYKFDNSFGTAKIVFYNVLGKEVKQIALTAKEGTEKIMKGEFEEGIFFYSVVVDNKTIATKKFVVTSK